MALEAGAEVEGNFTMEAAAPKIKGYDALNLFLGKPYNVWLNRFGERFADEGIVYNFAVSFNACLRQPDGQVWVVFNQALLDQTLSDGKDMIETIHMPPNVEERLDTTMEQAIADAVKREYPAAEVLMGTATAGIAHAAIAAHLLGLPMGYVRSGNKDHGRQNRIEGRLDKGEKVVVIEDLISTGGSVLETVEALREAGAEVLGVVSIFTYGMKKGIERMAAANVKNVSLTDLDTIAQVGAAEGYISQEDVARLLKFRENPSDESWIQGGEN